MDAHGRVLRYPTKEPPFSEAWLDVLESGLDATRMTFRGSVAKLSRKGPFFGTLCKSKAPSSSSALPRASVRPPSRHLREEGSFSRVTPPLVARRKRVHALQLAR